MKQIIAITLAAVLLFANTAWAQDGIPVILNGEQVIFDVPAQIVDDRIMVPMRAIFEALGADVEWVQETSTIIATAQGQTIIISVGESVIFVDGVVGYMDVPPVIVDSRTFVPLRFIAEALNCWVNWYPDSRTVEVLSSTDIYTDTNVSEPVRAEQHSDLTDTSNNSIDISDERPTGGQLDIQYP